MSPSLGAAAAPDKAAAPDAAVVVDKLDGVQEAAHAFQDATVTQEELDRLTVPEGLSDAERAQLYMSGGQAVQQAAVIDNLPGLLRSAGRGVFPAISRSLMEAARQLDSEGQMAAAESFATVARERLLPNVDLADAILPLVLAGVGDGGHPAAQAAWLACLADIAPALDPITLRNRVLPSVVARGSGGGRSLRERCLCCLLLGAVAPYADEEDLKRTLLRLAGTLCQDTEWQVRHAACQQLPALATATADKLPAAELEGVLEDLFGLLEDEEALVRAAAWRALAAALDLLPMRLRRSRALPLLLQQCRDPEHHAEVHRSLTAGLGALMARLVADMEGDAEVNACLGYFRSQAWRHDHATRLNCAAAFPAVLRAGTARRYGSHLHDTFLRLASDADAEVRLAAAAALPDVAASLGRDRCCQYLRQPVAALLQDERQEVQACLLGRLPEVLQHFCLGAPEEARTKVLASFVDPLLRLEAVSGYSWRLQLALLQALAAFPAFFSPDQLYERFLPLAWKYMGEGVAAVREAAAAAAAAVWRALRKPPHRTALYARAVLDFGQSKSFRHRMVFLDFCLHAQRHFSSRFIKAHLLEAALTLAYDPVANVRLHLAAAMPPLKQALALPDDVHLLERLNSGMSHLITDGDADVRREARKANEAFKCLPVRMSCGALESSSAEVKAYEAADAARAEAERDFLFDPEQLDKVHAEIAAYDEQLRPAHARLALSLPGQLASHLRSSSDGPAEPRRDKGLAASLQSGRSASMDSAVDGRLQQHRGAEASSGGGGKGGSRARADASRGKVAAQLRASAPGTPHIGGSTPHSPGAAGTGGEAAAAISAAAGAAGSVPQQQRRAAGWQPPAGSSPSRLSQQSPSAAAAGKAPPQPSRLSGALSGGGALAGNGSGGLLRRPSLKGAATRAAAEVQQLALKLRSVLLSGEPVAAAAAPAPAQPQAPQLAPGIRGSAAYGSSAPSRAAGSSGGGMKMSAEGRGGGGGGGLGFSVRGMTQLVGSGRAGPDTPGGR
ncbi:hypothetical protein CHLNCDRAFT_141930 [Chlorella variabilis]|uniref:Uncharacterized protein n=1 Tax=Chlorella variabilis TaxID=554065 RepID=E1Z7C8_CHLVA|nr:hypothetical protein CHLNCDRAFT_141930 [Chlorella variabilis]EFN58149.1 hypothetical protein CHLNCDRAFT_141930 [Chlorella variabilis]|eukprot:XP_005850251.1 hypothetical protein CHLNCDRAFT_141930 [Chlorella variabilis]